MFNRMPTLKIAAVALAASAIFIPAQSAAADTGIVSSSLAHSLDIKKKAVILKKTKQQNFHHKKKSVKHKKVDKTHKFKGNQHNNHNFKGSQKKHVTGKKFTGKGYSHIGFSPARLKREALYSCSAQLRRDAYHFGYKNADLKNTDVKQIEKDKFVVYGEAKLYDGHKLNQQAYECTVAHGKVVNSHKLQQLKY